MKYPSWWPIKIPYLHRPRDRQLTSAEASQNAQRFRLVVGAYPVHDSTRRFRFPVAGFDALCLRFRCAFARLRGAVSVLVVLVEGCLAAGTTGRVDETGRRGLLEGIDEFLHSGMSSSPGTHSTAVFPLESKKGTLNWHPNLKHFT